MKLDYGGDAGVPVQKYLVVQSGDACPETQTRGLTSQRKGMTDLSQGRCPHLMFGDSEGHKGNKQGPEGGPGLPDAGSLPLPGAHTLLHKVTCG